MDAITTRTIAPVSTPGPANRPIPLEPAAMVQPAGPFADIQAALIRLQIAVQRLLGGPEFTIPPGPGELPPPPDPDSLPVVLPGCGALPGHGCSPGGGPSLDPSMPRPLVPPYPPSGLSPSPLEAGTQVEQLDDGTPVTIVRDIKRIADDRLTALEIARGLASNGSTFAIVEVGGSDRDDPTLIGRTPTYHVVQLSDNVTIENASRMGEANSGSDPRVITVVSGDRSVDLEIPTFS